ncbi:MAG: hypothetical protein LBS25_10460 [Candidatus Symbiothrix sp.]|jgi:hypothetical protein|nr:hypothetical protein [Candidatus Symbiothrix sp.]
MNAKFDISQYQRHNEREKTSQTKRTLISDNALNSDIVIENGSKDIKNGGIELLAGLGIAVAGSIASAVSSNRIFIGAFVLGGVYIIKGLYLIVKGLIKKIRN